MSRPRWPSLALLGAAALLTGSLPALAQSPAPPVDMDALALAAQGDGTLNVIALQGDWCNYRDAIDNFKVKYGLVVNEITPDAGSGDVLQAIIDSEGSGGPEAPDVIDVALSFGVDAKTKGLLAPYEVAAWATIPAGLKDPEGYWYGGYYGVLTFETNTKVVPNPPSDWSDLLKPEYAGKVALPGDPHFSNPAIQAVYASAQANGGSLDDAAPGLAFWKGVQDAGNLVASIAKDDTIDRGTTPITIRWDYYALAHKDKAHGDPGIDVRVPATGPWAGNYAQGINVQAISAYAPHPNAARLWEEYLYSDEGQNEWLKGYCYPIRYDDLSSRGALDAKTAAKLPIAIGASFPSPEQISAASAVITAGWDSVVGVAVQ